MKDRVEEEIVRYLWRLTPVTGVEGEAGTPVPVRPTQPRRPPQQMTLNSPQSAPPASPFGAIRGNAAGPSQTAPRPARTGGDDVVKQIKRDEPKVGRNDPCPCGSGKKYKKCHGA
jgi:preprotein translocase subunit SecA